MKKNLKLSTNKNKLIGLGVLLTSASIIGLSAGISVYAKNNENNNLAQNSEASNTLSHQEASPLKNLQNELYEYNKDHFKQRYSNEGRWIQWQDLGLKTKRQNGLSIYELTKFKGGDISGNLLKLTGSALKTKKDWSHFLEYLAYAPEDQVKWVENRILYWVKDTFEKKAAELRKRFLGYDGFRPLINRLWKISLTETNGWNDRDDIWSQTKEGDIVLGGFVPWYNPKHAPIKPSDFMNASSKFKNYDAVKTAFRYRLQLIRQQGVSRDNIFATNINTKALPWFMDGTIWEYASSFKNANQLKDFLNLKMKDSAKAKFGKEYKFEILNDEYRNSPVIGRYLYEKNFRVNDEEGRVYFKVRATKLSDNSTSDHWLYVGGFIPVKLEEHISKTPTANEFEVEAKKFILKNAKEIFDEYNSAPPSPTFRKLVVKKYFDIKPVSPAYDWTLFDRLDWTDSSLLWSKDEPSKLTLRLRRTKAKFLKETPWNGAQFLWTDQADSQEELLYKIEIKPTNWKY